MGLDSLAGLISFPLAIVVFYKMFSLGEFFGARDDTAKSRKNTKWESLYFWLWMSLSIVASFVVGWGSFAILK